MGEKVNPKEGYVEQTGIMEKIVVSNTEEEIEEVEVIESWLNVTPVKASRSPKSKELKYGQVKIASRFSVLDDIDDNGDLVKEVEEIDKEDPLSLEKIGENTVIEETREEGQEDTATYADPIPVTERHMRCLS